MNKKELAQKILRVAKAVVGSINDDHFPTISNKDKQDILLLVGGKKVKRSIELYKMMDRLKRAIWNQTKIYQSKPWNATNKKNLDEHKKLFERLKLYIQWKEDTESGKFTAKIAGYNSEYIWDPGHELDPGPGYHKTKRGWTKNNEDGPEPPMPPILPRLPRQPKEDRPPKPRPMKKEPYEYFQN